jgi:hypothetical protein
MTRGGRVEIQILRNGLSAANNPAANPATGNSSQPQPQQP